jgi:hypothetical protein
MTSATIKPASGAGGRHAEGRSLGLVIAVDVRRAALAKAKQRGWTVVSMQNDFKVVFDL